MYAHGSTLLISIISVLYNRRVLLTLAAIAIILPLVLQFLPVLNM